MDTAIAGRETLTAVVRLQGIKSAVHGTAITKSSKPRIRSRETPIAIPRELENALNIIVKASHDLPQKYIPVTMLDEIVAFG
jgi:hypothetical protein